MTKLWGPIVWSFFHIYAQQINPVFFKNNTKMCLNVINDICQSLPCPMCTNHAKQFLKNYNFNSIKTKEQLILFLFNFHNDVNIRTKKTLFTLEELEIYKRGKILKITDRMYKELSKPLRNDNFILGMFKSMSGKSAHTFVNKYQQFFTKV